MENFAPTLESPEIDAPAASDDTAPRRAALDAFCRQVGDVVATAPEAEIAACIATLLAPLLATPDLLTPEQRAVPPHGYGRHRVFICPDGAFSILAAVWPAGIVSPIHDHMTWCALGVYQGVIRETRYVPAGEDAVARPVAVNDLLSGAVAHLPHDAPDIHSMHNPGEAPAISIHVYAGDADKLGPNLKKIYTAET